MISTTNITICSIKVTMKNSINQDANWSDNWSLTIYFFDIFSKYKNNIKLMTTRFIDISQKLISKVLFSMAHGNNVSVES